MRVLQLHCSYRYRGGEDTVVEREAELLRRGGHEVLQHLDANPRTWRGADRMLLSPWNPVREREVRALVDELAPDVVHIHNTWFGLSSSAFRATAGVPSVATLHNYRTSCVNAQLTRNGSPCERCVGASPLDGVRHRCRGTVAASAAAALAIAAQRRIDVFSRFVDLILCPSEFSRRIHQQSGLPAPKLIVKPNFTEDPGPRATPPSASSDILFVGRLSPEKGLDVLLKAWSRARPRRLRLRIIGDGPMAPEIRAAAVPGVSLAGRYESAAVREAMLSARALVFPSTWYEVQPLVLLEALAAGLPVLGSDLGAIKETLERLGPSALVEPGSIDAWSDAIAGLESSFELDAAGRAARAAFERSFGAERALGELEAHYERARQAPVR